MSELKSKTKLKEDWKTATGEKPEKKPSEPMYEPQSCNGRAIALKCYRKAEYWSLENKGL